MKKSAAIKYSFNPIYKKLIKGFFAINIFIAGYFSYPALVGNKYNAVKQTNNVSEKPITTDSEYLKVCFTPNQSCLPSILKSIESAKSSILLLGYSFTSQPIANALINAKKRGVKVRIVLDHSQLFQKASKESVNNIIKEHIEVRFDHSVKIAHNKVLVIDGTQAITGSYNWSNSADNKNAENLVFINSQPVAKQYTDYFEERWKIASPKTEKASVPSDSRKVAHKYAKKSRTRSGFKVTNFSVND